MCTIMIVTKGATADGSMMVTHSDDDELGDQRIISVPAQDHEPNSMRPVYKEHYRYPRVISYERGPNYEPPSPEYKCIDPIGYIPQVEHTYAYFDGNYGIMNEHNLMIGECTNGANYQPDAVGEKEADETGKHIRLFYSQELSRIALERCTKAREAIELMGGLIEEYGFYSTGETLLIADEDEAWVFEMCALPDEQYHSVWVAQQVPDGEFFVAGNEFRIRTIVPKKPDGPEIIHSKFLFPGLEKVNWWNPRDGKLDWLKTVSPGEYNHPYYSLRRVWRILDRVNPDLGLSPWVKDTYTEDYPFSIKPKEKLTLSQVFSLYRDHYEGTQFDLTQGIAAGPYNDPHRFTGPYDGKQNNVTEDKTFYGAWERAISVFYQGYSHVCQLRPSAPEATKGLVWFGPDVSFTTCYAPFSTQMTDLPEVYQTGSPQMMDCKTAWWAFDFAANWSRLNFKRMTQIDIIPKQKELEARSFELVKEWDEALRGKSGADAQEFIKNQCTDNAEDIVQQWWALGMMLVAKYSDGYINLPDQPGPDGKIDPEKQLEAVETGYPATWLIHTNYSGGPTTFDMRPNDLQQTPKE